jgi:putative ABC transport system permease protein
MIQNYIKVSTRSLIKHKGYSLINIFSLSVAISLCILIFMFVQHEHSYDSFHKNGDKIYHVTSASDTLVLSASKTLGRKLGQVYPEIEKYVNFGHARAEIKIDNFLYPELIHTVNPSFFHVFSFPMKQGKIPFPPTNKSVVVISPIAAEKYFGRKCPLGKIISLNLGDGFMDFTVSGIVEAIPKNSSIHFDFLIPTREKMFMEGEKTASSWEKFEFEHFILISDNADISLLESKSGVFLEKYLGSVFKKSNLNVKDFSLFFTPLKDVHLKLQSSLDGFTAAGNPIHSYVLTAIGLIVLFISCFNFINLSIARSSSRFREIGVRKVIGAARVSLIKQFWLEAMIVTSLALIFSVVLAEIFQPLFNSLTGKNLTFIENLYNLDALIFLFGLLIFISLFAGSYPAILLSRINVVDIFKGRQRIGGKSFFSRAMIVLQFALSLFLIIEAGVIFKQKNFLLTRDLGFEKEDILAIPVKARQGKKDDGSRLLDLCKKR